MMKKTTNTFLLLSGLFVSQAQLHAQEIASIAMVETPARQGQVQTSAETASIEDPKPKATNPAQEEKQNDFSRSFNKYLDKKKANLLKTISDTTKDDVPTYTEPFAFGDFTWLMGGNRQTDPPPFDGKWFTPDVTIDLNYTHSVADPIDNTVVGSTALARNNEMTLSYVGIGGDFHYKNVRGRFMSQYGTRSTVVPRNDISSYKGSYDLQTIYRYISEAYAGYHWNKWHGINLDAGIFMSYIGLFSYNNFENWGYQPSFTSDNTPWFFNGLRLQTFPTDKLKVELWLINGWQSYARFNKSPSVGASIYYRPTEKVDFVTNNYYGKDEALSPDCFRFHTDNSFLYKYYQAPKGSKSFITKAAFSLTSDWGFESGTLSTGQKINAFGSNGAQQQMFWSGMAYNRLWFGEKFAMTIGGGFMHNPGQYLVLAPSGYADTVFQAQTGHGQYTSQFDGLDGTCTFDYMPNQYITLRLEAVTRYVKMIGTDGVQRGYWAGHGGVTGPGGYTNGLVNGAGGYSYATSGSATPPPLSSLGGWMPDQSNNETRWLMAIMVRF